MTELIQRLSKSQYLMGLQCAKALWLHRHRPDLAPPISEQKQWLFDSGREVGRLAQTCFDDGHLIDEPYHAIDQAIGATARAMAAGCGAIYEATACSPDGACSRIDILKRQNAAGGWDLIEVKQSTAVKDYHLDDITLQRYAFVGAGHDVRRSVLMHLNRHYVRQGDLDVRQLFQQEDCTDRVRSRMAVAHAEFLHTGAWDPRPDFTRALVASCAGQGSVIVYNRAFESRINRELASLLPQHAAALEAINARMKDLLIPFRSRHLYHPAMMGSASIKRVLPAFVPQLRYEDLAIGDGNAASRSYLKCLRDMVTEQEKQTIHADLKRYCAMDTWAEVRLVHTLYQFGG